MSEQPTPVTEDKTPANTVLRLPPPSYVIIESSNGEHSHREDSFSILRMLTQAEKKPNEEQRWKMVMDWIAEKLKVESSEVTENMALHLHNSVVELTNKVKQEMSTQVFTIASSAPPIQESQQSS
jgi:hypothetical protein